MPGTHELKQLLCDSALDSIGWNHGFVADIMRLQGYDDYKTPWQTFVVGGLASLMVILATWKASVTFLSWYKTPSTCPKKLFKQLVKAHHLHRSEVDVLLKLEKLQPKPIPRSALFLDPGLWSVDNKDGVDSTRKRELFRKLFGSEISDRIY